MASYIIGGIVIAGFVVMTCVVLCPVIATAATMSVSAGSGASILAAAKVTGAALTDQPNTSIIKPATNAGTDLVLSPASRRVPWPVNDGFMHPPVTTTLPRGTLVDRFGGDGGRFVAEAGTPLPQRAMRPGAENAPYSMFEVQGDLQVQGGITAPAFYQPGGGIQYTLPGSVDSLLQAGVLKRVD